MERTPTARSAAKPVAVDLDAEIAAIAAMSVNDLRACWMKTFGGPPPEAFSKDLLARSLIYRAQETRLGGLPPRLRKLLLEIAKNGSNRSRHVKVGSILVREYQGEAPEVMVAPDGFCWRGQIYASLSMIAKKITGTSWNGFRFFGIQSGSARGQAFGARPGIPISEGLPCGGEGRRTRALRKNPVAESAELTRAAGFQKRRRADPGPGEHA